MKGIVYNTLTRRYLFAFLVICCSVVGLLTFEGCWKHIIYVEFDANGGVGEMRPQKFREGVKWHLDFNEFGHEGCYRFSGWNTIPDGTGVSYADNQEIRITSSMTLYAQWEELKYTVTFDANGGNGEMQPQTFYECEMQPLSACTFSREGYNFYGWYSDEGDLYSDGDKIHNLDKDITLHARWFSAEGNGSIDGHNYVDLCLPSGTKWATCNIGASNTEEYGEYFAWGETEPKTAYTQENYAYQQSPVRLPLSNDAAAVNWSGHWLMPTFDDFKELISECVCNRIDYNGMEGMLFTSRSNGNSVFLPFAGRWNGNYLDMGKYGNYWSSSSSTIEQLDNEYLSENTSRCLDIEYKPDMYQKQRWLGLSVRPVCQGANTQQ